VRAHVKLFLASSNPGKLGEYRALAQTNVPGATDIAEARVEIELLPGFDSLPQFDEDAPTFAENALGKALHSSRLAEGLVFADDSGLVVPALGGAPGVHSARYAGPNATDAERVAKLLGKLRGKAGAERAAYFVCAIALAEKGRAIAIVTARVDGEILESPRGIGGFGYDPVFYFPALEKTFAELLPEEKNLHSHRGKAFRKLLTGLSSL
jgi:XTP/dITP diphosphohydrolase